MIAETATKELQNQFVLPAIDTLNNKEQDREGGVKRLNMVGDGLFLYWPSFGRLRLAARYSDVRLGAVIARSCKNDY
jgi:hypothetical protein